MRGLAQKGGLAGKIVAENAVLNDGWGVLRGIWRFGVL
jgi:hypothetical protein